LISHAPRFFDDLHFHVLDLLGSGGELLVAFLATNRLSHEVIGDAELLAASGTSNVHRRGLGP
jgi:hypothetical protein